MCCFWIRGKGPSRSIGNFFSEKNNKKKASISAIPLKLRALHHCFDLNELEVLIVT